MAVYLTPDKTYNACGVTVKQRIIPFGTKATKDIYEGGKLVIAKGQQFKADRYLRTNDHFPTYITIHNTDDIKVSADTTKSEQYSRATYPNCNMGTCRIHYYVCEQEAWQNLKDNEIGWHVSYSKCWTANDCSISIEIIGNYAKAEDNGARLTAYLLHKYNLPIGAVRTHNSWSGKNCPCWILPHWNEFLNTVKGYLKELQNNDKQDNKTDNTHSKDVQYIMQACSKAAIRTAPSKQGGIIERVKKYSFYPVDEIIKSGNDIWLHHKDTHTYSMYEDEGYLFKRVGTYKEYRTTVRVNVRETPSIHGVKITVLSRNTPVLIFDGETTEADGYVWQKVLINNKAYYIAKQYLAEVKG